MNIVDARRVLLYVCRNVKVHVQLTEKKSLLLIYLATANNTEVSTRHS